MHKPIAKPVAKPNPPLPMIHKQPTIHKGGQITINGVTYRSIVMDDTEYMDIGLYYKVLEAFFRASEGARTGNRS